MEVSRAIDLIDDKMCWGRGTFSVHHMPEYDEYWQAGEMAIDALKKQEEGRWHPCSEKMPAAPFGCFVTVMDTNPITQEEFENILPYFVGWDGEQWNDADGERTPFEVIAWKPLPKPYKLEEES